MFFVEANKLLIKINLDLKVNKTSERFCFLVVVTFAFVFLFISSFFGANFDLGIMSSPI